MLRQMYRKSLPRKIRRPISAIRAQIKNRAIKERITHHYKLAAIPEEYQAIIEWIKQNQFHVFPYEFTKKYRAEQIEVMYDKERKMSYVLQGGNKMYWKKGIEEQAIQQSVSFLRLEQDETSPHRYLTREHYPRIGAVVADLGAAEGNFSLSIIDKVKKIYLFECDPGWIEALEATFYPWKEKVVIVNQFVGNGAGCIKLDEYFRNKEIDYIKADIEGAEVSMLLGAEETLKEKVAETAICTYHRYDDEENVKKCLELYGYTCEPSKGYMCFSYADDFDKSHFRRGLLYGSRKYETE